MSTGTQPTRRLVHRVGRLPPLGRRGEGWVAIQVVLLASILLSALVGRTWPSELEPIALVLGTLLVALGVGLLVAGLAALVRGSAVTPLPAPRDGMDLQTTGVYGVVRHPLYGGGILVALGWSTLFATVVGLVLTAVLAVFADLKARREEVWLEERFPEYVRYRRSTPHRLLPYVW